MLGEILDAHALAHLPEYLLPAWRGDDVGPIGGHREPPLPLDLDVLELSKGTAWLMTDEDADDPPWTGLESWEQDWRHTLGMSPYGQASAERLEASVSYASAEEVTLVEVVGFLRRVWPLAAEKHPAADEFARDIQRMASRAKGTLGMLEPPPWTVPCPAYVDDAGKECGYRLRVEDYGQGVRLHCPRGHDWTTDRLLLVARADGRAVWVDADTAADRLGTTRRGLAVKVRAGLVRKHGNRYDITTTDTREIG